MTNINVQGSQWNRGQRAPTPQELAAWPVLIRREAGAQVDVRRHTG